VRHGRTGVAVTTLLCAVVLAACTPDPVVQPTPSPTPTVATPTETAAERQERLDYAAAEKAYRTFRAEYGRVLRAGGAKEPTKVMKETAGGDYLATFTEVIRNYKESGSQVKGIEKIRYVRTDGYGPRELSLEVCEDGTKTTTLLPSGESKVGEVRTANLQVKKLGAEWKIWAGTGMLVNSCAT